MNVISAIVLAAGKGNRMQSDVPKQYLDLEGKPVLYYSLKRFEESNVDEIIVVVGKEDLDYVKKHIVEKYHFKKITHVIEGGAERYWSVEKGLQCAKKSEYVLIHDAARPCLTQKMIKDSIMAVKKYGACTVAVPVKDTIKRVDEDGFSIDTPKRDGLWQIQTPQSFLNKDILEAYRIMKEKNDLDITDDTMIIERYLGKKTKIILGDYCNIKITTQDDLEVAKSFLKKMKKVIDMR